MSKKSTLPPGDWQVTGRFQARMPTGLLTATDRWLQLTGTDRKRFVSAAMLLLMTCDAEERTEAMRAVDEWVESGESELPV